MEGLEKTLKGMVLWCVSKNIIGYHTFSHGNNANLFSHIPGGWTYKVKSVVVWLVSGETFPSRFHVSSLSSHVVNYEVEVWSGRDRKGIR